MRRGVSAWLIGFEDEPERSGELCLVEVFGDAPSAIGSGVHAFRDPALHEEFPGRAPRTRPPELLVRRVSGRPGLA